MAAGSTIGTIFKVTTWGESHGKAIGVVVDGCPAGLPLDESDIQKLLDRRNLARAALRPREKRAMRSRSSPVSSRERLQEHRSP